MLDFESRVSFWAYIDNPGGIEISKMVSKTQDVGDYVDYVCV